MNIARKRRSGVKRLAALLTVLFLALCMSMPAFASSASGEETTSDGTTYYDNWEDYTAANKPAYVDGEWKFHDIRDAIFQVTDAGRKAVEAGDTDTARQCGSDAYYGFYDLAFENATNMYISGSRVKELELLFGQLRTLGASGDADGYNKVADTIEADVNEDADKLDGQDYDSNGSDSSTTSESEGGSTSTSSTPSTSNNTSATMLVFFGTYFDILREGIEAMIVVAGIIAYLRVQVRNGTATKRKTLYPVYFGALFGIVCSFIMAWILNIVRTATGSSSHQQELVEGLTGLLAVAVLFWTCNWMLSKSETESWTAYIKGKTQSSTSGGNVFGLAFASFLAVFREGAEAVLFLQPYMRNAEQSSGVVWGVIVAGLCLVVIFFLINFLSVKLPMRIFFNATSILMAFMCVCFLGSGLSGLIEAEVIGAYSAPWVAWIPMNNAVLDTLGIYPYVNTIVPQLILAGVLIVMFIIQFRKNRQIRLEGEARAAEEKAKKDAEEKARAEEEFRKKVSGIVLDVLVEQKLIAAPAPETKSVVQNSTDDTEDEKPKG